jgi:activator of HSP90 ATPase
MKLKTIRHSIHFHSTAGEIYELLMISKRHAAFSGSPAKISVKVGGPFTAYDGYIEGTNLELFKGKKIVQSWRTTEWPKGHFSTVTWTFRKPDEGGVTMDFLQEGVPLEFFSKIEEGWHEHYWEPMKAYLARLRDEEDR